MRLSRNGFFQAYNGSIVVARKQFYFGGGGGGLKLRVAIGDSMLKLVKIRDFRPSVIAILGIRVNNGPSNDLLQSL